MSPIAELTTDALAFGTLALQLVAIAAIILLVFRKTEVIRWTTPYLIPLALVFSLAASVLTLLYSESFGFAPCGLCWLERAFLYPIPVLAAIALWARDAGVTKYIIGLSIPGAVISLYHHYLQMGGAALLECPAAPGAADCAQRFIFELGYITFPLMAFTVFIFLIVLMVLRNRGAA